MGLHRHPVCFLAVLAIAGCTEKRAPPPDPIATLPRLPDAAPFVTTAPTQKRAPNSWITARCDADAGGASSTHLVSSAGWTAQAKGKVLTLLPSKAAIPIEGMYMRPRSLVSTSQTDMAAIYSRKVELLPFTFASLADDALPVNACIVHMESESNMPARADDPMLRIYALAEPEGTVGGEIVSTAVRAAERAACAAPIPPGTSPKYSFSRAESRGTWLGMSVTVELWLDTANNAFVDVDFRWKRFDNATLVVVAAGGGGSGSHVAGASVTTAQALDRLTARRP